MQHTMTLATMSLTSALRAAARRAPSAASSPIASCSYSAVSSSLSSISARRRRRCLSTSQPLVPEQHAAPSAADLPLSPSSSHLHLSRAPTPPPLPSPYFVARGKRNNTLGVFSETKSGGTRDEICIRHVTGDLEALKDELVKALDTKVRVNARTGSVILHNARGTTSVHELKQWLEAKGF